MRQLLPTAASLLLTTVWLSAQEPPRDPPAPPRPPERPNPPQAPGRPGGFTERREPGNNHPAGDLMGPGGQAFRGRPGGPLLGDRLLVVWPELPPAQRGELEEDATTMLVLAERTILRELGTEAGEQAMGIRILQPINPRESQAVLLDHYGLLLTFRSWVPLSGPAADRPKPSEPAATAWEKARRELYGARRDPAAAEAAGRTDRPPLPEFDAKKMHSLQDNLCHLLAEAANIRHLKPEHYVVLGISGPGHSRPALEGAPEPRPPGNATPLERFRAQLATERGSSLVVRARKAEIDAFAAGKLTREQFRAAVSVIVQ